MLQRKFGRTGWHVSAIGSGAKAIGADWGNVSNDDAAAALYKAMDFGTTFVDIADVCNVGRSERMNARILAERGGERPVVATKAGRGLLAQTLAGSTPDNLNQRLSRNGPGMIE